MARDGLSSDPLVIQRVLDHIDRKTTDLADVTWREPVENYLSPERFDAELRLLRRWPVPFCPSALLPTAGAYLAREAAGTPLLAVRGEDGVVRAFRNTCRHRGAQVAEGSGCAGGFMCPFHGWTYGLDGALRHVPHEEGFPGLDRSAHALMPVRTEERGGLVFVTQEPAAFAEGALDGFPELIPADERLHPVDEIEVASNWKLLVEGFLEGYHIRPTHKDSFFPHGFDNLNVIETFGRNRRVTFPFRAIEKFRARTAREGSAERVLSYVHHLFPNVLVVTFPDLIAMVVLEPIAIDRTRAITWSFAGRADRNRDNPDAAAQAMAFLDAGVAEDRAIACSIQKGLKRGANTHFEFGRFEGGLTHFHQHLNELLGADAGPA